MPKRIIRMNNDGLNLAVSTGTGLAAWLATFSAVVPVLWGIYVLILIAIKLPELHEKNPMFRRACAWVMSVLRGGRRG
ncbi:phage protein [Bordetella trematum]|uniref:Phage protein n=2 Tax=Bordetella trematum TaxID=123899 RepID=A0A157S7C0_9BORD|nr:phage protein [Bordetella trematum]SAI66161.1 phage protein [Bordetella trematum]SAI72253.1 phage protein [Bordetella trematum]SUV96734.1 phage protein [Bordetella trematum]SUV97911.1 phage protein [Bordetella trematum]